MMVYTDTLVWKLFVALKDIFNEYSVRLLKADSSVMMSFAFVICSTLLYTVSIDYRAFFVRACRRLPGLRSIVQHRINKALRDVHQSVHGNCRVSYLRGLPKDGISADKVLLKVRRYKAMEYIRWSEGFASGCVYPRDEHLDEMAAKVFKEFVWTNPLHPDLFPDVRRMEAELVRMCLDMYHGDDDSCGTTTSGGTESIMLACLAYRELARSKGIHTPQMILPVSAHPAFDKAAFYFSIEVIRTPVDPVTLGADFDAIKQSISSETCMLVASAPGFPHGIIDPVKDIAELGRKHDIPVHVDCCLGGFLLPFMTAADFPVEPFDFRLPGVTSISCDTHKFGFAAKGTSVIMYRNKNYRSMQFFTQPNWSGGVYASPTFAGSRSGALIAVCWATMLYFGRNGYIDSTRRIVKTTRFIADQLKKIPGIFVYGTPEVCVIAFGSKRFDIYSLSQKLSELPNGRGWNLNNLQFPPAVHLCVTDMHTAEGRAEGFIRDVATVAADLYNHPKQPAEGSAAVYGMCATLPDRSIISEVAKGFLDACYDTPITETSDE